MKTTLIEGLTQSGLESFLTQRQYNALYWPSFFPLKNVATLDSYTLIGDVGSRIAASVISYNASSPEHGRKAIRKQHFDIPKIAIKRTKDEKDIIAQRTTAVTLGQNAVIDDYFNDIEYVSDSCQAKIEEMALSFLSKTTYQLTTTNNPLGIVNEEVIDSGMPSANKKTVAVVWSTGNASSMTPIADIKAVVKAGRAKGHTFSRIVMNADAFDLITGSTEFQTACKSMIVGQSLILGSIGIESANAVLSALGLPTISLINTSVGIEDKSGVITYSNPWDTNHVLFIPSNGVGFSCGSMHNGPIAEELIKPAGVLQAKRGNVLVSVKEGFDPISVTTKGECNVFPSWTNVDRCYSLYIANTSTWA